MSIKDDPDDKMDTGYDPGMKFDIGIAGRVGKQMKAKETQKAKGRPVIDKDKIDDTHKSL